MVAFQPKIKEQSKVFFLKGQKNLVKKRGGGNEEPPGERSTFLKRAPQRLFTTHALPKSVVHLRFSNRVISPTVSLFSFCELRPKRRNRWHQGTRKHLRLRAAEPAEFGPSPISIALPPNPIATPMDLKSITLAARRGSFFSLNPVLFLG